MDAIDSLLDSANNLLNDVYRELEEFNSSLSDFDSSPPRRSRFTLPDSSPVDESLRALRAAAERMGLSQSSSPRSSTRSSGSGSGAPPSEPEIIDLSDAPLDNTDDDIIIVNQPIEVVDLCSPQVTSPATADRRRRRSNRMNAYMAPYSAQVISPGNIYKPAGTPQATTPESSDSAPYNCPICLENCFKRQPTNLSCGHVFCEQCIRKALETTKSCPLCKRKATARNLTRLYFH